MKRFFVFFIFSLFLFALPAQTIYHYKLVAKVDLRTEEKVSASGKKLHLIYNSREVCLCNEDGNINKEEAAKNEQQDFYGAHSRNIVSGQQYHLQFQKSENGMNVYSAHYKSEGEAWTDAIYGPFGMISPGMVTSHYIYEKNQYLYVSSDKRRINYSNDAKSLGTNGYIEVYELYDKDVVGQRKTESINPGNLNGMY